MERKAKFTKAVTTRFPEDIYKLIEKLVKERKKEFPRYTEGDMIRSAVINHLKLKGYLKKGKNYL